MSFDFFTFGGGQFWEDVFFYQKWRIQRNCDSKKYRLLDPWDIRRHKGTFEECRRAFVDFVEVYEISRQRGHMIIMLHGLGETKNVFKPLWRKALEEKFMAAAINYPSTQKTIDAHVRQLNFLLNNLEDVNEVSFVTLGMGGIVLRKLLNLKSPWIEKLKINRIVQINPPNKGHSFLGKLSKYKFFRFFLGPMAFEATPDKMAKLPGFPKYYEVGVIFVESTFRKWLGFLPAKCAKMLLSLNDTELAGAKDKISIKNANFNYFENRKVVNAVIQFLKKGKF